MNVSIFLPLLAPLGTDRPSPGTLPMTTRKPPRTYPPDWTGTTEARRTTRQFFTDPNPEKQKGKSISLGRYSFFPSLVLKAYCVIV